jgi:hypothetical protein
VFVTDKNPHILLNSIFCPIVECQSSIILIFDIKQAALSIVISIGINYMGHLNTFALCLTRMPSTSGVLTGEAVLIGTAIITGQRKGMVSQADFLKGCQSPAR